MKEVKMIYTKDTKKAMRLCYEAHKDQMDKSGVPYVFHPFHVAEQMKDEDATIVALLHDVAEDSDYTLDDMRAMGFSETVLEALDLLTHREGVPYMDYVAALKGNRLAREVKLADLAHNSDTSRLDQMDSRMRMRLAKYSKARELLLQEAPAAKTKAAKQAKAALRGKHCEACGEFVEEGSAFCPFCGEAVTIREDELTEGESDGDQSGTFCQCCGNAAKYSHRFCSQCGQRLWTEYWPDMWS